MKRAELFVLIPIVMAGAICLAQEVKQLPPAAGVTVPTGAGRGAGRGGFGGPIELGPDDKPSFPDPPAGFNVKRDNIAHGELTAVPYDSKSLGTRRQMRVYTPPGYSANRKYPVLILLHGIGGNDPGMDESLPRGSTLSTTCWPKARFSRWWSSFPTATPA